MPSGDLGAVKARHSFGQLRREVFQEKAFCLGAGKPQIEVGPYAFALGRDLGQVLSPQRSSRAGFGSLDGDGAATADAYDAEGLTMSATRAVRAVNDS